MDATAAADNLAQEALTYGELPPEVNRVALLVLDECRTQLMMSFRYLDLALWKMPFRPLGMDKTLSTDGMALYYDPQRVIKRFRANPNEMVRDYLHAILHCVFRHPFETHRRDTIAWETACDLCVEAIALEMCESRYPCASDAQRAATIERLRDLLGSITPAKAYRALVAAQDRGSFNLGKGVTLADLVDASGLFIRDNHDLWNLIEDKEEEQPDQGDQPNDGPAGAPNEGSEQGDDSDQSTADEDNPGEGDEGRDDSEREEADDNIDSNADNDGGSDERSDENGPEQKDQDGSSGSNNQPSDDDIPQQNDDQSQQTAQAEAGLTPAAPQEEDDDYDEGALDAAMAEFEWKDIAERIEADLQTMSIKQGTEAGNLMANLELTCRKQINYRDFLHQFATVAEDMKLNDEEFDYIFYTYGMNLFGNMPLVEALEYKESERVREFVIALDTSGSTSGSLVKHFVERTYEILKETESFGDEVTIHIVQCDASIQEDATITCLDDLDRYLARFEVRGMGGTDFRPVFAYVNKLVEEGEFENLRGLVYFTDGMGTYPDCAPDYDVAFVFVDNDGLARRVPPWAMRVVMDDTRVRTL